MSAPIDVFVKMWPRNALRERMAELVLERLQMLEDVRLWVLLAAPITADKWLRLGIVGLPSVVLGEDGYHAWSKDYAAGLAESDVYVVLDDDHLPIARDWVERGARVLRERPDFAMLASWSINGEVVPEAVMRSVPGAHEDDEVFEAFGLGTPYFARRGQIPQETFLIEGTTAHTYDPAMSDRVRAFGKLGFLKGVRHNHLGIGFSTVSAAHWEA